MNESSWKDDVQWLTKQKQYHHTKSEKKVNCVENSGGIEHHQQHQTILNLYHSGIPTYIVAFQLDMNEDDIRTWNILVANWFCCLKANTILGSYSHEVDNGSDSIRIYGCHRAKYAYL